MVINRSLLVTTNEHQGYHFKSKITKIPNSEEKSKRKVLNQMAKSNDQTYQTNGQQLTYF